MEKGAFIARGVSSQVYEYGDGRVVKVLEPNVAARQTRTRDELVRRESAICRLAGTQGVRAPEVYTSTEIDGRYGIVYERVDGPTMIEELLSGRQSASDHGRMLAELHRKVHRCPAAELETFRPFYEAMIRNNAALPEDLKAGAIELLLTLPDAGMLCHGDFHGGNVVLSSTGPVVIDWACARSGLPLLDFCRTTHIYRYAPPPPDLPAEVLETLDKVRESCCDSYREAYLSGARYDPHLLRACETVCTATDARVADERQIREIIGFVRAGLSELCISVPAQ